MAPAASGHGPRSQRGRAGRQRRLNERAEAAAFDHHGGHEDRAEDHEAARECAHRSESRDERRGGETRQRRPVAVVRGGHDRAGDERGECHDHPRAAAAHAEEGARGAPAAELHADAEDECADGHRHARRLHETRERHAERLALGEQREEHRAGEREQQHLRAHALTAPIGDEHAPRRREAEGCVVEHEAGRRAHAEERAHPPAERGVQHPRRRRDDQPDRDRPRRERPAVASDDGRVEHGPGALHTAILSLGARPVKRARLGRRAGSRRRGRQS